MMRLSWLLLLTLLFAVAASACDGGGASPGGGGDGRPSDNVPEDDNTPPAPVVGLLNIALTEVVGGFQRPTFVTSAPGDASRLYVLEKGGRVRIVKDGRIQPEPFIDIASEVITQGNEQGLLGLAFHPKFAENRKFYLAYTAKSAGAGDNTVAEFTATSRDRAEASTKRVMIAIPDFAQNHNGGMVAFGRDGFLYYGTGDGGGAGDSRGNGQKTDQLLGKILRIDVDRQSGNLPYAIPADNPFVSTSGARGEIWAYGLRNPWRFSFDRETGDLWIADVGQNKQEEINFQAAASKGGENYGWNVVEGSECFQPASGCDRANKVAPVAIYDHDLGCSVTGGYVYRGKEFPALVGRYLYTDYCSGRAWSITREGGRANVQEVSRFPEGISSFGEDANGELYVVSDETGKLLKVTASSTAAAPSGGGGKLVVASSAFEPGMALPAKYTCDGEGVSPPLSWDTTPPKTRTFVVLMENADDGAKPAVQWIAYGLPPVSTFVAENIRPGALVGSGPIRQGKNDSGVTGYSPPCPEKGQQATYRLRVFAVDTTLQFAGEPSRADVVKAMEGHILAEGNLNATYRRK